MGYIHSSKMRSLLGLILKFQELTTSVNLLDADGKPKAHQIYYRMRQTEDGTVELKGYPIVGMAETDALAEESGLTRVIAEEAFYNGDFWLGSPKDVYKDIGVGNRQAQRVVWAAAFENEKHFAFAVDETNPLVTMLFSKAQLERLAAPSATPAVNVGSIDDSTGVLVPPKGTVAEKDAATKGKSSTLIEDLEQTRRNAENEAVAKVISDKLDQTPGRGSGLVAGLRRVISGTAGDHPLTPSTPNPGHA